MDESRIQANEPENRSRYGVCFPLTQVKAGRPACPHAASMTAAPHPILIIQGHPDPAGGHLCHALATAYARGAEAAGHRVEVIDVAMLDLPLLRSQAEFEEGQPPAAVVAAQAAIGRARHLVIVFPLWLGTMPALLKAFFEQVLRPGFGFAYRRGGLTGTLLDGRSARIIVTMGMPAWLFRWIYLGHGVQVLRRSILALCGIGPVRTTLFGSVKTAPPARRQHWLAMVEALGRRGL